MAELVGRLAADDEAAIEAEQRNVSYLTTSLTDARQKQAWTATAFDEAQQLVKTLNDRQDALPGLIAGEGDCMASAADYRDRQCATHWAAPH